MIDIGHVLLADVGGTNVRFALADPSEAQPLLGDSIRRYRVADFATFTDAALAYLGESGERPRRGVFAVAGPVGADEVCLTNHPWDIRPARARSELALEGAHFVNDFAAMSLCVVLLGDHDVHVIGGAGATRVAASPKQTFAVLGPGTGLGVGALLLRDGRTLALETEGGHTAFAPRTDEEVEILRRLGARFGRVSNERLLCGSGLANLHQALGEIHGTFEESLTSEEITQRADIGTDPTCVRAAEVFCELLGAVAGDFVLALGAWDGVYLSGGMIAPLLPWLERGGFRRRFEDKGRLGSNLARVPTLAIVHPYAGLLGAAAFAVEDSGRTLLQRSTTLTKVPT
ncbi:glucokinase [Dokdonella soli]|uniref:Glucokinase n=1 Tax=Dokdonella soli TaxID=529810 RepID=A0ABN1IE59_9GAMM